MDFSTRSNLWFPFHRKFDHNVQDPIQSTIQDIGTRSPLTREICLLRWVTRTIEAIGTNAWI